VGYAFSNNIPYQASQAKVTITVTLIAVPYENCKQLFGRGKRKVMKIMAKEERGDTRRPNSRLEVGTPGESSKGRLKTRR
jgi:hypothetical protein